MFVDISSRSDPINSDFFLAFIYFIKNSPATHLISITVWFSFNFLDIRAIPGANLKKSDAAIKS